MRSFTRTALLALLGVLLAFWLAPAPPALAAAEPVWRRLETAHFALASSADEATTASIAHHLELLRATLASVEGLTLDSPLETRIFVFGQRATFRHYQRLSRFRDVDRVAGFFVRHRDGNYLAIDAGSTPEPLISHEYLHYVLSNSFPDAPLWFNEGLAELFSSFTVHGGRAVLGRPPRHHLQWLATHPLLPLDRLFAIDSSSPEYHEGQKQGAFYAQSWALVHALVLGRPDGMRAWPGFLARLEKGVPLETALGESFGLGRAGLEAGLKRYKEAARAGTKGEPLPTWTADAALSAPRAGEGLLLPRAEVRYLLGDLLAHASGGQSFDAADRHLKEAIELDPRHAGAWSGLGYLYEAAGRIEEADRFYAQAVALEPSGYLPWLLYAEYLMTRLTGAEIIIGVPPEKPAWLDRARALFQAAIDRNPRIARAWAGLGATWLLEPGDVSAGVVALEKALAMKSDPDTALDLVLLCARRGDRDRARATIDRFLGSGREKKRLELARQAVWAADLEAAQGLVRAGRTGEGLEQLKALRRSAPDSRLATQVAEQIRSLEHVVRHNDQVAKYNRALELARARKYGAARQLLHGLMADAADPEILEAARELDAQLRQYLEPSRTAR